MEMAIGRRVSTVPGGLLRSPVRHDFFLCLGAWILACLLTSPAWADGALTAAAKLEPLVLANNLALDAGVCRERRIPIVVFYSRPGCSWCELVRASYLVPLANDPAYAGRIMIREIRLGHDKDAAVVDFGGRSTAHEALGQKRGIRLTPTLDFLDAQGKNLVEPIVGVRAPDFYGAQVERAIDDSIARLRGDAR